MTTKGRSGRLGLDDSAVTTVLGAILVAAILMSMLVTVRVSYVPVWENDAEADHMRRVVSQLSGLKADLDFHVSSGLAMAGAHAVDLHQQRASLFSDHEPADELRLDPAFGSFNVSAPTVQIKEEDGERTVEVFETWAALGPAVNVTNVVDVQNFRIRFNSLSAASDGQSMSIRIWDADQRLAGRFNIQVDDIAGTDWVVIFTTFAEDGSVLARRHESYFNSQVISPHWADVLAPEYRFEPVLAAAKEPFAVDIRSPTLAGSYALSYEGITPTGEPVFVGGTTRVVTNYQLAFPTAPLVYRGDNGHYIDQRYVLDNGGLVLQQADRATFRIPPTMEATLANGLTLLSATIPSLAGAARGVQGDATAAVHATTLNTTRVLVVASQLNLTLTTPYPSVWADFWTQRLVDAGLDPASTPPQFAVTTAGSTVLVQVRGTSPDWSSTVNDVQFNLAQAYVNVRLQL